MITIIISSSSGSSSSSINSRDLKRFRYYLPSIDIFYARVAITNM